MNVKFDINDYPDLIYFAKKVTEMEEGKIQSIDLKALETAIGEMKRIERTCEEAL